MRAEATCLAGCWRAGCVARFLGAGIASASTSAGGTNGFGERFADFAAALWPVTAGARVGLRVVAERFAGGVAFFGASHCVGAAGASAAERSDWHRDRSGSPASRVARDAGRIARRHAFHSLRLPQIRIFAEETSGSARTTVAASGRKESCAAGPDVRLPRVCDTRHTVSARPRDVSFPGIESAPTARPTCVPNETPVANVWSARRPDDTLCQRPSFPDAR